MTSPLTSTSVATNGAEALAGSKPSRRSTNGSIEPASVPEGDDADRLAGHGERDQQVVLAVERGRAAPRARMRTKPIVAEHGAEREPGGELAADDAPPVAQPDLAERHARG